MELVAEIHRTSKRSFASIARKAELSIFTVNRSILFSR